MSFNKWGRQAILMAWVALSAVACGGGGSGGGGGFASGSSEVDNVLNVTVDSGPNGRAVNSLYATVTVCQSGSTARCQTIDHVLVDTGSTGLRLLASVLDPSLNLGRVTSARGTPLISCAQFLDNSFAWGPVALADITLGRKKATSTPIQLIADPQANPPADMCSNGVPIRTVTSLGAKGILGIGLFQEDCGSHCVSTTGNGFYFTCTDPSCALATGSTASTEQQVKNPIPLFPSDNNGFLVDLPAVASSGAPSLKGRIVFGIGTQANNRFNPGVVLRTSTGSVITVFSGRNLFNSFLDTGSNALFFDTPTLPSCGAAPGFYCPTSLTGLSATLQDDVGTSATLAFAVDNASDLFANSANAVLPTLSGPIGDPRTFDWGLPFFYGRPVFIGIQQQTTPLGTGPFYAF